MIGYIQVGNQAETPDYWGTKRLGLHDGAEFACGWYWPEFTLGNWFAYKFQSWHPSVYGRGVH